VCARAVTLRSERRNRNAVELMANLQIKAPTGKPDFADMLRRATAHHQRGQLDEAETLYRQVLAVEPDNFNALHLCGVLMHQRRQPAEALKLIARALKTNARSAPAHSNYGIVLAVLERHEEALRSYDRALALQPDYAEAFNNRGNALRALQRTHDALLSFEQAIAARPGYAEALNNRGNALIELGRGEEALASYEQALAHQRSFADAMINRGNVLRKLGRREAALASFDQALALKPEHAETHVNRGNVLLELKLPADALQSYDRAIALQPRGPETLANRGRALRELKRYDESLSSYDRALALEPHNFVALAGRGNTRHAMQAYEAALADYDHAITIRPDHAEIHSNRGNTLRELGRHHDALEAFNRALTLNPDYDEAYNNRGNVLIELNRPAEALADYDRALTMTPDNTFAWVNRGNALRYLDRAEEAIASFDRAIALNPELAEAHWNKGLLCLSIGDFARGWADYEWRWRRESEMKPRNFPQPQWRGGDLSGKTILLHAEQGFGDTIQFVRFLPMVAQKGGKIILELPDSLRPLIRNFEGVVGMCRRGDPLPPFDVHCALLSLPLVFGTTLATIPATVPYLWPPAERIEKWRTRLAGIGRPRVGLVWSGKPTHKNDHNRSIALSRLEPLLSVPGIQFVSLQNEYRDADLKALERLPVLHVDNALVDFADTAAVISELDLVIAVDTAVAHLAGAMARPLWVLLSHVQDWRWMRDRVDSPWYPTARLFRQPQIGDWDGAISYVAKELAGFVKGPAIATR
jgi:tetratricopeptide (TPR) repeat protein